MDALWQVATATALGAWLLLTVHKNLPQRWRRPAALRRLTASWLVPGWAFFAPTPGTKCYHLIYRDLRPESSSPWQHLPLPRTSTPARFLWNPNKTASKALVDVANEFSSMIGSLSEAEREQPPLRLQVSLPYLTLLDCVSAQPRLDDAVATQFALGQTDPDEATVLVVSSVHRIGEAVIR